MLNRLATVVLLIQVLGKGEARVAISPMEKPGTKSYLDNQTSRQTFFSLWPLCLKYEFPSFLVPGISQNNWQNADERALPPAYLSVPNFKDCMGRYRLGGSSHVCLLLERPPNCPHDSFERLRQLRKVILSCRDTHQNQPGEKNLSLISQTFCFY